ncbi:MAG TPA: FAD-dependent oxidoreductase [Solirubrobacteraceae bacterium]|jgi:2,4-dienoyl-CoA reductase-like NADH-dependent reductase (Old Yellow Enzyme family)|nr:FAD-dependent oxidoreductase [Solirubrobacteraceae bacterium]
MQLLDTTPPELAPLFAPIVLGSVEIRNRIVMAGHSTGLAENYLPSERHVAYYRERARGGAGLIGMAFPVIHPTFQEGGEPRAYDPAIVPGLARIADAVHAEGGRIAMQLGHGGRQGSSVLTERALWAPSNIPCPFNLEMPKEMEREDIDAIVEGHALGARHAKQGGMDGVEIHSGYGGYLLASFFSPFSNFREDEYGGPLENRVRILLRVIDAVRDEVGDDYLVGLNLQGHDFSPHGLEAPDAQAIARAVEAHGGIDYIYVKGATYYEANQNVPDMQHPKLIWASLAAAVKEAVDIPVVAVGRMTTGAEAVSVLESGQADLVALTRQQIADPETVNKLREGRLDDIRHCVACNQGCIDRLFAGSSASCIHNPAAGYELELGIGTLRCATEPKRVIVVGAGPGGLKAAEVAARAGHDVTLFERREWLGGQLRLAATVSGRAEIGGVITYLETQVAKLGVDVRLGAAPDVDEIRALAPDHVIVATGSAPGPGIVGNLALGVRETPGLDRERVLNVWDVLERQAPVGDDVLVADDGEGGWKAIGLALQFAQEGRNVHLSSPLPYVAAKIGPFSRNRLMPRIFASGITTHEWATIASVGSDDVTLRERGRQVTLPHIDTVVLAGWHRPVAELYFALKDAGVTVQRVGDAIACRSTFEAVHEGERAARRI